jgi:2-hydroxy-6-oxonona-2,4-dienedioate hydrolase
VVLSALVEDCQGSCLRNPSYIDVKGVRTRYFQVGTGRPIVLIHGGQFGQLVSSYSWSLNLDGLARRFQVIAFDRLGQGFTGLPKKEGQYTMQASVQHSCDFMEAMGVHDAIVVGHSRGAYVAARIALEHPEMVSKLVIVDSNTLPPDDPSTPRDFYARLEVKLPEQPTVSSVRREAEANSYSAAHITRDFVEELLRTANLPTIKEARRKMNKLRDSVFGPALEKQRGETLGMIEAGELRKPTLIVWGFNDPSAPYVLGINLFRIISAVNPDTSFHLLNQAGHYSFRERPKEFDDLILAFAT